MIGFFVALKIFKLGINQYLMYYKEKKKHVIIMEFWIYWQASNLDKYYSHPSKLVQDGR